MDTNSNTKNRRKSDNKVVDFLKHGYVSKTKESGTTQEPRRLSISESEQPLLRSGNKPTSPRQQQLSTSSESEQPLLRNSSNKPVSPRQQRLSTSKESEQPLLRNSSGNRAISPRKPEPQSTKLAREEYSIPKIQLEGSSKVELKEDTSNTPMFSAAFLERAMSGPGSLSPRRSPRNEPEYSPRRVEEPKPIEGLKNEKIEEPFKEREYNILDKKIENVATGSNDIPLSHKEEETRKDKVIDFLKNGYIPKEDHDETNLNPYGPTDHPQTESLILRYHNTVGYIDSPDFESSDGCTYEVV